MSCSPTRASSKSPRLAQSRRSTTIGYSTSTLRAYSSPYKKLFRCFKTAVPTSIVATKGLPALSVYSATKAAVRSFARAWTTDLKDRKIRVNAISPRPIQTPGLDKMGETKEQTDQIKAGLAAGVPLGRLRQPDEIANAALFLASDESRFVTGIELFVDGGLAQV